MHRDPGFLLAIEEAKTSARQGGVPIGACLVSSDGKILGKGHNMRVQNDSATLHVRSVIFKDTVCRPDIYLFRLRYPPWRTQADSQHQLIKELQCTPPSVRATCKLGQGIKKPNFVFTVNSDFFFACVLVLVSCIRLPALLLGKILLSSVVKHT